MDFYDMIMNCRFSLVLAAAAMVAGCAVEASPEASGNTPATIPAAPCKTAKPGRPSHDSTLPAPEPRIASVVYYVTQPDCMDGLSAFGLDGKGQHPTYAQDDRYTYPVTGVYDGPVYLWVGDECRIGGDYDGYDLFLLGTPVPR